MPAADPLSTTFAALADPTRRAILARLAQGDATVGELAKPFAMTLPGVSKHLKVLQHAGLVVQGRDAQWRPCQPRPDGPPRGLDLGGALPRPVGGPPRPHGGAPPRAGHPGADRMTIAALAA